MSLSKERQEYHLTPGGWIEGTFHRDFGVDVVPVPEDRVLTICCVDELFRASGTLFESGFRDYVEWESDDKKAIEGLKRKYGEKPDWFGYKK